MTVYGAYLVGAAGVVAAVALLLLAALQGTNTPNNVLQRTRSHFLFSLLCCGCTCAGPHKTEL